MSTSGCHPSRRALPSSDEQQPPNMWQGHRPCAKWFGKCSIYSVSPPLCFLKLASCQKQDWFASICKVDVPHLRANALFCEFSTFFVSSLSFRCRQGEDHLGQISVLDICGDNVDRNVCKMLCFRQYCKWINLFTLENGRTAFGK